MIEKKKLKKILSISLWSLLGLGGFVLLIAALNKKDETVCKGIEIRMAGVNDDFFINKQDIRETVIRCAGNNIEGKLIKEFNLDTLEMRIRQDVWIDKAELFFDKKGILNVEIEEKDPVARVFCADGTSYYLDNEKHMLPLSRRHAARLPVFTGFPSSLKVLSVKDSALLEEVRVLSNRIRKDDFLMAMIDQIDINTRGEFEMIPKLGEQVIVFGTTEDMEDKFRKLNLFYKKVMRTYGWSRYSKINLQYKGQIVTTLSGTSDVSADSAKTLELLNTLATYTSLKSSDTTQVMVQDNKNNSTDPGLINKSMERDETGSGDDVTVAKEKNPVVAKPTATANTEVKVKTTTPAATTSTKAKSIVPAKPKASNVKKETAGPKAVLVKKKETATPVNNKKNNTTSTNKKTNDY